MLLVKVGTVDMDGLQARDEHPSLDDQGKTGTVVEMRTEQFDDCGCTVWHGNEHVGYEPTCRACKGTGKFDVLFFRVRFEDGHFAELAEYELQTVEYKPLEC